MIKPLLIDARYLLTDNSRLLFLAPQVIEFSHSTVIAVIHIGLCGRRALHKSTAFYTLQSSTWQSPPCFTHELPFRNCQVSNYDASLFTSGGDPDVSLTPDVVDLAPVSSHYWNQTGFTSGSSPLPITDQSEKSTHPFMLSTRTALRGVTSRSQTDSTGLIADQWVDLLVDLPPDPDDDDPDDDDLEDDDDENLGDDEEDAGEQDDEDGEEEIDTGDDDGLEEGNAGGVLAGEKDGSGQGDLDEEDDFDDDEDDTGDGYGEDEEDPLDEDEDDIDLEEDEEEDDYSWDADDDEFDDDED